MSFRSYLERLDSEKKLIRIKKEVSPEYDASAIMSELDGQAVYFEKIKGSNIPAAGGFCSSRDLIADSLNIEKEKILFTLAEAIKNRKPPAVVESGECQELVEKDVDLTKLPILKYLEGDGGKYIASAISVIRDPELGRNVSFHRLMLLDKKHFAARLVENRGTDTALRKAGGELDIAIAIGNTNAVLLAASTSLQPGEDEFSLANTLCKTELVRCKTVDLEVPKDCEIVLEGRITKERRPE
ncbi:MAG: UbiD family decarboxylase, partial [Thermoplasmata archaeon]|nr:UbiD family decarboxylase [Thermoplasmata archaeon]